MFLFTRATDATALITTPLPCRLLYTWYLLPGLVKCFRAALVAGGNRSAAYLMEWLGLPTLESSNDPEKGQRENATSSINPGKPSENDPKKTPVSPGNQGDEDSENDKGGSQEGAVLSLPLPPPSPPLSLRQTQPEDEHEVASNSLADGAHGSGTMEGPAVVLPPEGKALEAAAAAAAVAAALERGRVGASLGHPRRELSREETPSSEASSREASSCEASSHELSSRDALSGHRTSTGGESAAILPSAAGWRAHPMDEDEDVDQDGTGPSERVGNGILRDDDRGGGGGRSPTTVDVNQTKVDIASAGGGGCGGGGGVAAAAVAAAPQRGDVGETEAAVAGDGFGGASGVVAAATATGSEQDAATVRRGYSASSVSSLDSSVATGVFSSGASVDRVSPPANTAAIPAAPVAIAGAVAAAAVASAAHAAATHSGGEEGTDVDDSGIFASSVARGSVLAAKRKAGLRVEVMPSPKRVRTPEGWSPVEGEVVAGVCEAVPEGQVRREGEYRAGTLFRRVEIVLCCVVLCCVVSCRVVLVVFSFCRAGPAIGCLDAFTMPVWSMAWRQVSFRSRPLPHPEPGL